MRAEFYSTIRQNTFIQEEGCLLNDHMNIFDKNVSVSPQYSRADAYNIPNSCEVNRATQRAVCCCDNVVNLEKNVYTVHIRHIVLGLIPHLLPTFPSYYSTHYSCLVCLPFFY